MTDIDPKLLQWATPRQRQLMEAWQDLGSAAAAAKAHNITSQQVRLALKRVQRKAARAGYDVVPLGSGIAQPGFHLKDKSFLTDAEGNVKLIWHKHSQDPQDRLARFIDAVEDLAERQAGLSTFVPPPATGMHDLLAVYPMGDPHIGMFSWAAETGDDFDLKIAAAQLIAATDLLVEQAPPAKQAIVLNLGDFFHADNAQGMTMRSGHRLDTDSRWPKVLQTGIDIIIRIIQRALEKHESVYVINVIGNHDDHSAVMLALVLDAYFRNNPRVTIAKEFSAFHYYRFGANLIGTAHGNRPKRIADLPEIMAADRPRDWGETTHRYWYTGHVHHDQTKEFRGCIVESFRTLAPRDAWHHNEGYRAGRDMKCDILKRKGGRPLRYTVDISEVVAHIESK